MLQTGNSAALTWARAEARRRWRSLAVLGILVGVTAGLALAVLVGSRQNDHALQRLREATNAHDITVFASQTENVEPDWERLRTMPEVDDLAVWLLLIGEVDGEQSVLFGAGDDRWLDEVNRPLVTEGRMYDPAAPDEVVVSESATDEYPIGATIHFTALGSDVLTGGDGSGGPDVTFRVVGAVRTIGQFLFTEQAFVSPGFMAAHAGEFLRVENADLQLRDPAADVAAVQAAVNEVVSEGTPLFDLNVAARRSETTLGVESIALVILAAVIAIAGGLLVAQAAGRSAASIEEDATTLRALGMTDADLRRAILLAHVVTLAATAVTLLAVAIGMSGLFPVGLGRDIHPDVGLHVAWAWILPAVALTMLLTVGGIELAVFRVLRRQSAAPRRSLRPIAALRRLASVPVALGITMAFEPGRGARRMPVRPALIAAVVGVAGVIGTLSINAGIEDALAHPELGGQVSDIVVSSASFDPTLHLDPAWVARIEAAAPGIETAEFGRFASSVGGIGTLVLAIRPTGDDTIPSTGLTLTSGRRPAGPGEVALGPKTARDIGASVGDDVTLDALGTRARVVGIALFPPEVHGGFDDGAWLSPADYDAIDAALEVDPETWLGVEAPEGHEDEALDAITAVLADGSGLAQRAETPIEVANLRNVRTLPVLLAGFLTLLAVASLSHVLATAVRRRARDFAVLRALGLERGPTRAILNAQGTAIATFGLLAGIPIGVLLGREGWPTACRSTTCRRRA